MCVWNDMNVYENKSIVSMKIEMNCNLIKHEKKKQSKLNL